MVAAGHQVAGVITLPAEAAEGTSGYLDFGPFCSEHGIPFLRTRNVSDPEVLSQARRWSPALGVGTPRPRTRTSTPDTIDTPDTTTGRTAEPACFLSPAQSPAL